MPRKSIAVNTQFEDFHCWLGAPEEVAYLRSLHRHVFHVKVFVEVSHGNRNVEFHLFKDFVTRYTIPCLQARLKACGKTMSCEDMAEFLALKLINEDGFKAYRVVVSEDGENEGIWEA